MKCRNVNMVREPPAHQSGTSSYINGQLSKTTLALPEDANKTKNSLYAADQVPITRAIDSASASAVYTMVNMDELHNANPITRSSLESTEGKSSSRPTSSTSELQAGNKVTERMFPRKLHKILADNANDIATRNIISWHPNGRMWRVNDPSGLEELLPKYFKHACYRSFKRQVNIWNFNRVNHKGPDHGYYFHELFVRDQLDRCKLMERKVKTTASTSTCSAGSTIRQARLTKPAAGRSDAVSSRQVFALSRDDYGSCGPMTAVVRNPNHNHHQEDHQNPLVRLFPRHHQATVAYVPPIANAATPLCYEQVPVQAAAHQDLRMSHGNAAVLAMILPRSSYGAVAVEQHSDTSTLVVDIPNLLAASHYDYGLAKRRLELEARNKLLVELALVQYRQLQDHRYRH